MSRCEPERASTLERAGFYLPISGVLAFPDAQDFKASVQTYDYVPVYTRIAIENFDITRFYQRSASDRPSVLLESLTGEDNGRYSILADQPILEISSLLNKPQGTNLLQAFFRSKQIQPLKFPFFTGGLAGFWCYEAGLRYVSLPPGQQPGLEQFFFMPGRVVVYDRYEQVLTIVLWCNSKTEKCADVYRQLDDMTVQATKCCNQGSQFSAADKTLDIQVGIAGFQVNITDEQYEEMVREAKKYIRQGDIFQVVLSRRWKRASKADPWQVYLQLRRLNPSPYMFYFRLPGMDFLGASPEMQVKIQDGVVKMRPIAGTRKVTGDVARNRELEQELIQDEKEQAEHLMLVDLGRNDVGKVSRAGTVHLTEFMKLERYSHVVHIVSTVEGQLKPEVDAIEAFAACFPAGTLTGAPKRKAMEIISELEQQSRGPYGGAVGTVGFDGNLDSCISIRALVYKRGTYYLQAGAGIVADSNPELEHKETFNKGKALMLAILHAEVDYDPDDR